jgi:hypothetical protein
MSRPSKAERESAKHAFFLSDFDKIQNATREGRVQSLGDRRFAFVPGAQWEGPAGEAFANKPRFEFNKIRMAMRRILSEYRNNRISVGFSPKDGREADKLADTCSGLYRADEQDSGAQEGYDNCFDEGASGGMGALRLRACYVDEYAEDDDRQRIAIEPIYEADSCVFFSLDGKRYDKSDAKRCYVLNAMSPFDYTEEYGDDPTSWPKAISQAQYDWCTPDVVWVAEVYEIEEVSVLVHYFRGLALGDEAPDEMEVTQKELDDDPNKLAELEATGFRKTREKRRKVRKVHKWIMSGGRILEDCGYIAGKHIPIVPFYGERTYIDGIERFQGHVRLARDAQVLDNVIKSFLGEMAMRFDIEKPIVTPEMIAGHAEMWASDAIEKYPFLMLNSMVDPQGGPPQLPVLQYTKAPNLPPVVAALAQLAAQSLEDMLGNQQAGEQLQPNQSGKAVELIQNRLDMQVFIYMDNFAKTIKRVGEVWLPMKADVTQAGPAKTVGADGAAGTAEIMRPVVDDTGARVHENDLSQAKFDVVVDVGPSSSSKRAATVRGLTGARQFITDPETGAVVDMLVMMNLEGEGLSDVQPYFRKKLVRMGALTPSEEEKKAMAAEQQNQQPGPQDQYLMAAAQKAQADAGKAIKDGILIDAKVAQSHADTIATLAGVEQGREAHAFDLAVKIDQATQPAASAQPSVEVPQ